MRLRSLRNLPWFVLRNRLSLPHRGITLTLPHLQVLTVDHPVNGFMNFLRRYLRDITAGKMLQPKGDLSYEELLESYTEQVTAVANAGVDLLVAETMLSVDETCVFMDAALSVCDLPIMCSLTLEADGSALFGGNAVEAVETLQEMGASAVGLNCSVGPDQLEAVVNSMKKVARVPVIVKPNAGLPKITPTGEAIYSMDAPTFAKYMNILVDAGAGIVGGCCGTTPEYIRLVKEMLDARK